MEALTIAEAAERTGLTTEPTARWCSRSWPRSRPTWRQITLKIDAYEERVAATELSA